MSCKLHPVRKRKGCSDCFPVAVREEKIQTSREMLAELDAMEQEEKNLVIKAPRKQREKKPVEEKQEVVINISIPETEEEIPVDKISLFQESINRMIENGVTEFNRKIKAIIDLRYEYIDISVDKFNVKTLDSLYSDGFHLINFYRGEQAKVSGFKGDVVLLNRVVNGGWKKTVKEWKEVIK